MLKHCDSRSPANKTSNCSYFCSEKMACVDDTTCLECKGEHKIIIVGTGDTRSSGLAARHARRGTEPSIPLLTPELAAKNLGVTVIDNVLGKFGGTLPWALEDPKPKKHKVNKKKTAQRRKKNKASRKSRKR